MGDLMFFGESVSHQAWIEAAGWSLQSERNATQRVLVCVFDNKSNDPLVRLKGSIESMRDAVTAVQEGNVTKMVLVTDGAGFAGSRKLENDPLSATFLDEHGMGVLTCEVLGQMVLNAGTDLTIIRGNPLEDESIRSQILDALA
jgi:hypothetical protein